MQVVGQRLKKSFRSRTYVSLYAAWDWSGESNRHSSKSRLVPSLCALGTCEHNFYVLGKPLEVHVIRLGRDVMATKCSNYVL